METVCLMESPHQHSITVMTVPISIQLLVMGLTPALGTRLTGPTTNTPYVTPDGSARLWVSISLRDDPRCITTPRLPLYYIEFDLI